MLAKVTRYDPITNISTNVTWSSLKCNSIQPSQDQRPQSDVQQELGAGGLQARGGQEARVDPAGHLLRVRRGVPLRLLPQAYQRYSYVHIAAAAQVSQLCTLC